MNRRQLFVALAGLPFVGRFFRLITRTERELCYFHGIGAKEIEADISHASMASTHPLVGVTLNGRMEPVYRVGPGYYRIYRP